MVHRTHSSHQQLKPVVWAKTVRKLSESGRREPLWSGPEVTQVTQGSQPTSQPAGHRSVDLLFIIITMLVSKFGEWSEMAWHGLLEGRSIV